MLGIRTWLRLVLLAGLGFALLQGGRARAASFDVNPVRVSLSAATPSGLVAVHNFGNEPLRFQATVFAWTQGPAGEMQLAPTDEIVVFPTMFTIKPGDSRNMRVGSVAEAKVEKAYRVFVTELPALQNEVTTSAIRVLTRMGIPVFVSPPASKPLPQVDGTSVQRGQLAFALRNAGSAFFMARRIRITGVAADGHAVFTSELPVWYMLAGTLRAYTLTLPDGACAATRLAIDVEAERTPVHATVELPPGACAH